MRSAKSGYFYITEPQRQMANNSAVYNEKPDAVKFMEEWLALAKSGTGERGIFNRGSLKYQLPERRWKTFEKYWQTCGTNPCVTADTWIMTQEGPRQVQDLIGVPFVAVVNGKHHLSPTGFFSTGKKETFLIRTQRGFSFKATADHPVLTVKYRSRKVRINEWKLVKDLLPGDEIVLHNHNNVTWQGIGNAYEGWLLGSLVGDGNIEKNGKANLDFWGPTRDFMLNQAVVFIRNSVLARSDLTGYIAKTGYARVGSLGLGKLAFTYGISYGSKCITPDIEKSSSDFYQGFLRGWFDADGSVQGDQNKGVSVRLSSNSLENLEAAQRMLARLGIISTIYENRKQAGWMMLPDGRGGEKEYFCKAYHELIITGSNILTFYRRIGFSDPQKRDKLEKLLCLYKRKLNREKFSTKVIAIEPAGIEEVYDCFVSDVHAFDGNGVFLHNCGEIILRSKQFCNLTEVVCRPEDTEESLLKKVRIATILGTYQSMLTDFPYLSKEWKENCEEERLLGVSLTGQWDCPQVRNPETLRKLKEHAIEINKIYAKRFGINPSMAITCIKPSGCRPWYALTSTTDGLLTLEELFEHHNENRKWDEFGGSAKVIQNPHPARILKTYQNGFDRLLRITMNYGLVVESTLNHPWFVSYHYNRSRGRNNKKVPVNKWVEARNLKIGDVLELKLGVYSKTDSFRLEKLNSLAIKMRGDVKDIYQPDYMNQDLAWFLGYLWGDGALSPGKFRIRFVDQYKENLEKAARVLKEQFGIDSTLRKASEHRKAYTLEIGSKMLWHWLIKNNVFKYYADRIDLIPRCVRASSRDDIIAFIAGLLDSDGWVGTQSNKNGYTLTITTSDPFFAQHLQDVAWAVGLGLGRSLNSKGNNLQKEKQMYLLTLGRYVDPDAFNVLAKNSNKIQTAIKRNDFKRWLWQNKKNNTLIAGKIIKIEEVGVVPTYDIEVENHWYYAGCVKSHNTVSQLVDSSSGMHPRHSQYYIRRVRISATDPLFHMLRDQKFPYHPEVGQLESNATTFVLDFPVKAPDGAITRHDLSALDQLNHWKMVKLNYTEHNPSVTIYIRNNEWLLVADWLYQNWDILGGLSFLPMEEHVYQLAPYEEITKEEYEDLVKKLPDVDFSAIVAYEKEDSTSGAKELACVGNVCEIDIAESTK
jgi:intein/homing endonuclease